MQIEPETEFCITEISIGEVLGDWFDPSSPDKWLQE
jgi:hypothetical protein